MENNTGVKRCVQVDGEQYLFPGIPSDITSTKIIPKLSWRDVHTLSSVNRVWNRAVRSRQVYTESLQWTSKVTSFLVYHDTRDAILLYSIGEKKWYKLPPLPDVFFDKIRGRAMLPYGGQYAAMNGKVYVLGGRINSRFSSRVFVFDVVAGGKWEKCASMNEFRQNFICAVKDGKIYAFGGQTLDRIFYHSSRGRVGLCCERFAEVYDPDRNAWSPIKKTITYNTPSFLSFAMVLGDEIFLAIDGFIETYHPLNHKWRTVQDPILENGQVFFTAEGKVHAIGHSTDISGRLAMFTSDTVPPNAWTSRCSFSLHDHLPCRCAMPYILSVSVVEDELLAIVTCTRDHGNQGARLLLQSKGFGSGNEQISWEMRDLAFVDPYRTKYAKR